MKKVAVTSDTHVMILVVSMSFHTFASKISHVQNVPGATTTSLKTVYSLILFHHPLLKLFHGLFIVFYISVCIFDSWQIRFVISSKQGSKA
jgi:hypothetical protein